MALLIGRYITVIGRTPSLVLVTLPMDFIPRLYKSRKSSNILLYSWLICSDSKEKPEKEAQVLSISKYVIPKLRN